MKGHSGWGIHTQTMALSPCAHRHLVDFISMLCKSELLVVSVNNRVGFWAWQQPKLRRKKSPSIHFLPSCCKLESSLGGIRMIYGYF